MGKMALRIVGGPHDGAVREIDDNALMVQIAHQVPIPRLPLNDEPVMATVKPAVYRRRTIRCEDGKSAHFLCWSEFSDYQAICFLLKVPAEE